MAFNMAKSDMILTIGDTYDQLLLILNSGNRIQTNAIFGIYRRLRG